MGYIVWNPVDITYDLVTSHEVIFQLWMEFESSLRLRGKTRALGHKQSYLEQARTYFTDAVKCEPRSAGLLYYYSLLNLAKYLITLKKYDNKGDLSTKFTHGLTDPRPGNFDLDYPLKICRPARNNVFTELYGILTGDPWPFEEAIELKLRDISPYCIDLGSELQTMFNISPRFSPVFSRIRTNLNEDKKHSARLELLVQSGHALSFQKIMNAKLIAMEASQISSVEKFEWNISHHLDAYNIALHSIFSIDPEKQCENLEKAVNAVTNIALKKGRGFFVHSRVDDRLSTHCYLVLPIKLKDKDIRWHPVLTDYLYSFAIGSVLRYSPILIDRNTKYGFLFESWIRQSPVTCLRYFLMNATSPSIRVSAQS